MALPAAAMSRDIQLQDFNRPDSSNETEAAGTDIPSLGVGKMLKGVVGKVSSAAGAVASLVTRRDDGTEKTVSEDNKKDPTLLEEALSTVDELNYEKSALSENIQDLKADIDKQRQEIIELRTQLAIPQDQQLTLLKKELDDKDRLIVEKQARIEQLLEDKPDKSHMLGQDLGRAEANLAEKNKQLNIEQARVRAAKHTIGETREELEKCRKKCLQLASKLGAELFLDEDIVNPTVLTSEVETQTIVTSTVPEKEEIQDGLSEVEVKSSDHSEPFMMIKLDKSPKDVEIEELRTQLKEKEFQLGCLENQLNEAREATLRLAQVQDHSKGQSRALMSTKQELEATKMSHEELVQYIHSLERQVEDAEAHSRNLEGTIRNLKADVEYLNKSFVDTKKKLEEQLDTKKELEEQLDTKKELEKQLLDLQNQLAISKAEAELYKEDFDSERKDREKAHDLKEDMRVACDQKVHAMTSHFEQERAAYEDTIMKLTRRLEGAHSKQEQLKQTTEIKSQRLNEQNRQGIQDLHKQLYESRQKAIAAQEEVLAKTAQVKQYKKKDDQREEKLTKLQKEKGELAQQMETVRKELEKTKEDCSTKIKEQSVLHKRAMEQVRQELLKIKRTHDHLCKTKKLSNSDIGFHAELVKVQEENASLQANYDELQKKLQEVQEQYSRLRVTHINLKQNQKKNSQSSSSGLSKESLPHEKRSTAPVSLNKDENSMHDVSPTGAASPDVQLTILIDSQQLSDGSSGPGTPSAANEQLSNQMMHQSPAGEQQILDTYNRPPVPRAVPLEPDEATTAGGYRSFSSKNNQLATAGYNYPQARTGPLVDLKHLTNESCTTHSAPSSGVFSVSQEDTCTRAGNMQLVLGEKSTPKQYPRPQNLNPDCPAQQEPCPPVNQPRQGYDYNFQQDQQMKPQQHLVSPNVPYSQGQQLNQHNNYQLPPQGHLQEHNYQQPGQHHSLPEQYPPQHPLNYQWEYNQQGSGPQQQYWPEERHQQQLQQYNQGSNQLRNQRQNNDYRETGVEIHSHEPPGHDAYPESELSPNPLDAHAHNRDIRIGVDLQSPHSEDPQEKPKPKPRQLNAGHKPEQLPSPPDPPSPENPNATRLLVEQNALHDNIDKDISEAAAEVTEVTQNEKEREGAPLDPNLVCPMCMKQYRIGEIQLFRAHVNKCDGTKH